ncbi:MAG: FG-GAP-like repeat-containing protein [Anaerolineae bacterium]|nr:FG-GAP-like repeat-containing protein [Anaerolineae bacterium]
MFSKSSIVLLIINLLFRIIQLTQYSMLLYLMCPMFPPNIFAQSFTDITTPLTGVRLASVAWGDYDGDGDLDILLSGNTGTTRISIVYRNNNGNFVDAGAGLTGLSSSSAAWGDYDNDGDLDILLTGFSGSDRFTLIYNYNHLTDAFTNIGVALTGVGSGGAAWGDYDNDGDLDIVLSGFSGTVNVSKVYRNDSGNFLDINATLIPVIESSVAWGDYDNDGDLDLLLTGDTGAGFISKVYRNDNEAFVDINVGLDGVAKGGAAWGDYDSDGDLDILLAGDSDPRPIAKVYRNDGNGTFSDISAGLQGVTESGVAWGDFDNDGDLDILLAGRNGVNRYANIYRNVGNNFSLFSPASGDPLVGVNEGSSAWGDYDNDGVLDILLAGNTGPQLVAKIYRNNFSMMNTVPTTPSGLAVSVTEDSVTLSWNKSSDNQTSSDGLTYNLRIGTTPAGVQRVSPMADVGTGYRRVVKFGNTNHQNSWTIRNLQPGTYYWSVQSIDNTFMGSAFAVEQSFQIGANAPPMPPQNFRGTPGHRRITLIWNANTETDFLRYRIYGGTTANPTTKIDSLNGILNTSKVIIGLTNGATYFFRITGVDSALNESGFSNEISLSPRPLSTPQSLQATPGDRQVTLSWNANPENDFLRYRIYGGTTANPITKIDSVDGISNTAKVIAGLTNGVVYFFRITAVDTALSESVFSNEVSATPTTSDPNPAAPQNLQATVGNQQVTLTWNANTEPDFLRYRIYGGTSPNPVTKIDSVNSISNATKAISGVTNGITYYFRITAVDAALQESGYSNEVIATPVAVDLPPAAPANLRVTAGDQQVTLVWNANSESDFLRYRIYRGTAPNPATKVDSVGGIANTTRIITGLTNGVTYYFRIRAIDGALQQSGYSNEVSATPTAVDLPPAEPQNLRATFGNQQITLTWNANIESDFLRYRIYGGTAANPTTKIDSTNGVSNTSKVVTGLVNGVTYFFRLKAVDNVMQESGYSNETSATPFADASPPNIVHTAVPSPLVNQDIIVDADITDVTGVQGATLNYRRSGNPAFTTMVMSPAGGNYRATIPAPAVTSRGIEYYISASDVLGLVQQSTLVSVQVRVVGEGESKGSPQPGGSEQTAYRLVSVPLDLDDKTPRSVLEDDLGAYDIFKWRCYEVRADQTRAEYPNISEMAPGKALWLIVKDQGKVIDTGAGRSNRTDKKYAIALHPGWNLVANPFNFRVPFDNLSLKSSGLFPELRSYTGSWNNPVTETVSEMLPFQGYAVFNTLDSIDSLLVDPDLSVGSSAFSAPFPNEMNNEAERGRRESLKGRLQTFSWSIQIHAQCQQARDADNIAAIMPAASKHWDELDFAEPPVIGEYVSVYFPHDEWDTPTHIYCTDVRPEPSNGEVWEFEVATNIRDVVHLRFEGIESVPQDFEIWLVNEALKISQNLREHSSVAVAGSEHPKLLKLVVGRREFVNEKLTASQEIPVTYELSQNFPNPFNPVTTIRFGLPKDERVTLKVYNLLGEEVATLASDEKKKAGYHAAIWNGMNRDGQAVASGIYLYQLRAGSIALMKKMAVVK